MNQFMFEIKNVDGRSRARTGVVHTGHGDIQTPAFVPVGTQASVKGLANQDLQEAGTQVFFVNTYHIYLRPGLAVINKFGGLHRFIGWNRPLMSDSAGFQIFSLGDVNRQKRGLCLQGVTLQAQQAQLVKISEEGVKFRSHLDGSEHFFTPEKSIEAQGVLGADMMIAFDECTYYPADHDYTKEAMERTHRWALRCLTAAQGKLKKHQALFGVVQGGVFKDLREQSAAFIANLPFDGIAIGGVAVGESKKEMLGVLDWVVPLLPEEKVRHLLGVGEIDDIFTLVEKGIDTFDCVMPARLGRMGHLLVQSAILRRSLSRAKSRGSGQEFKSLPRACRGVQSFTIDITKAEYAEDKRPIDETCDCFVCKNYHRAYINHLFRAKELLAYRLATYHNLYFVEKLMQKIRRSIKEGKFMHLKEEWLAE